MTENKLREEISRITHWTAESGIDIIVDLVHKYHEEKAKLNEATPDLLDALEDALQKLKFSTWGNQDIPRSEVLLMYPKQAMAIKKATE